MAQPYIVSTYDESETVRNYNALEDTNKQTKPIEFFKIKEKKHANNNDEDDDDDNETKQKKEIIKFFHDQFKVEYSACFCRHIKTDQQPESEFIFLFFFLKLRPTTKKISISVSIVKNGNENKINCMCVCKRMNECGKHRLEYLCNLNLCLESNTLSPNIKKKPKLASQQAVLTAQCIKMNNETQSHKY